MAVKEYFTPTHVYFGEGAADLAGKVLKEQGAHKVLIHYGGGSVVRSGLLDSVKARLDEEGVAHVELGGVVPNPRVSLVREGVELYKKEACDYILAVGGGSVLDSSKAIGYGVFGGCDPWDFYCGKRKVEGIEPVGCVLTLSATGSEMSNSSVITNDDDPETIYKLGVKIDYGRPKFALMDPALTATVPPYQTGCGSTDIMMHTFERYFHQGYSLSITDELSFALIREVIKWTPVALEKPDDYDARANLMWAGSLSHNGLMEAGNANMGDWACHQMEHEISAEFDVAHGAGLAAIWGSWARYVLPEGPEKFKKLGEAVFGESDPVKTIEKFEGFFRSIGMPTDIKGLGLEFDEATCRKVALGTTFGGKRTIGNFKVLGTEDIFNIMMMASGLK